MKKSYFFALLMLISFSLKAQLILSSQPNGTVDVSYGNDYTLFDPQSASEIYLYIWIDTDQTTPNLSAQFNDDWNTASSLITLNYDSNQDKFVGVIDFNTHDFVGEGVLPQGTQIDNFNLILRNQAGDSQTASNLLATDYAYTATTTLGIHNLEAEKASYYSKGIFYIKNIDEHVIVTINIYDILGKNILHQITDKKQINLSHLQQKYAIIEVKYNTNNYFVKKIIR